jgi:hypothetical protein
MDFIFRKDSERAPYNWGATKNILNPVIERFQLVSDNPGGSTAVRRETVLTYNRGVDARLSINYKFIKSHNN